MKAYMTLGTRDFLEKLVDKHPDLGLYLMGQGTGTLAYYENQNKNVFSAGNEYEIISENGEIEDEGYVVMNNIPVLEDSRDSFEQRFKQRQHGVDSMPGFQAFRFLRPLTGKTYVVMTQWRSKEDFENWKNSDQFKEAHKSQDSKPPAYFADRPFITSYHMKKDEEGDQQQ
ncbi:antibiotic biosynthesis monooxygenase family protein [Virgibacillus sediminis]|uniref:Antibiotic biosynthesis monooxygenase family protein n=1 Tax=Virgibacillus sediminis TaxID=202260 RepID=A0ABV7AA45_9BACI